MRLHRAGSLVPIVGEIAKFELDLLVVQGVKWDGWH
jgi:hypothetical protein